MDARQRPRRHMSSAGHDVYKEGALKPTPSPVLVRRFSGQGGWHETCAGILGLTKMDWNNNTLYKKLPVTLGLLQGFRGHHSAKSQHGG